MDINELIKQLGFENEEEFHRLVSEVDISTTAKLSAFKYWQHQDGSKTGLLALPKQKD